MNAAYITPAVAAGYSLAAITAAAEYRDLRDRRTHPLGEWDRQGRWYADSALEACACCAAIRDPSRAYPLSWQTHCRTAAHVATRHGVAAAEVKRLAAWLDAMPRAAEHHPEEFTADGRSLGRRCIMRPEERIQPSAHEIIAWQRKLKPTAARAAEIRAAKAAERAAARAEAAALARVCRTARAA